MADTSRSGKTTIFLASSSELKAEREALELRVNRLNKQWHADGVFLDLQVWEDFIDAMSPTRKQDDYNAAILKADIFLLLVSTKVGKYSAEEFKTAHDRFKATRRPLVYTYFKNPPDPGDPDPGPAYGTVRKLLAQLARLGHFPNYWRSTDELVDHVSRQLDKLKASGFIQARAAADATGSAARPVKQRAGRGSVQVAGDANAPITVTTTSVKTGGGAYFGGAVKVQGDLIGRDRSTAPPAKRKPQR